MMWLSDPTQLFASFECLPRAGDSASSVANALTRLLLLVVLVMWWKSYEVERVVLYGLLVIFVIYIILLQKKENFSPLDSRPMDTVSIPVQLAAPTAATPFPAPFSYPAAPAAPAVAAAPAPNPPNVPPQAYPVRVQEPVYHPSTYAVDSNGPDWTPSARAMQAQLSTLPPPPLEMIEVDHEHAPQKFYTPQMGVNTRMYQRPMIAPRMMDGDFSDIDTNRPVAFNPLIDRGMSDERDQFHRPRKSALTLERTEDVSSAGECLSSTQLASGDNRFYLQDIQPNVYSFSYDPTPINANLGIAYTPQIPPRTRMTMCDPNGQRMPLYSRVDPQLIRSDVSAQRAEELPPRGPWSEKYSPEFEARGSVDVSQIYDPRFSGHGDEYRSYRDVSAGNIKYYYTDVDAYKSPNFIVRNKIDHVDLHQPMGNTYSTYPREAALEDVRDIVNDDWAAKSTEFREDMMERLMRPANARNWQMRYAPQSRGAHLHTFSAQY
jgi:hypothetical protein